MDIPSSTDLLEACLLRNSVLGTCSCHKSLLSSFNMQGAWRDSTFTWRLGRDKEYTYTGIFIILYFWKPQSLGLEGNANSAAPVNILNL